MKAKNVAAVYRAWMNGQKAHSGSVSTDGVRLWSYRLQIGHRGPAGAVVADYTASGVLYSATTSKHVHAAARAAGADRMAVEAFRVLIKG